MSLVDPCLLSVDHLLLHGGRGPHSRRTDAVAAKQRTVAYQSGRGQREQMLCHHELITIVTPLSRPGSAKTTASLCLYSVYRKQERSLFTAALEQTSNVLTAIIRPRQTVGLWSRIPSIRSAIASLGRAAHLLFDSCPLFHAPIPLRRRPIVQRYPTGGGEAVIPRPVVRGPMAVALPRSRSPRTLPLTVLSAQLPAVLIVRRRDGVPSSAVNGAGSSR